jgi:hypothetical protein
MRAPSRLAVFLTIAAATVTANAKPAPRRESFQYYDCRIELDVPPGWQVEARDTRYRDITLRATARGGGSIEIAYYQPLHDRGFQDFRRWARDQVKQTGGIARYRTIDGSPAVTIRSKWDGGTLIETDIGFKGTNEIFVILLQGFDEKASPRAPADYESIVRSVKITVSPAPPGPSVPTVP